MQYIIYFVMACTLVVMTGCSDGKKDYAAAAKCQDSGNTPGTKEYDDCVKDEKLRRAMQEQRDEYERAKQYQQDQTLIHTPY